MQQVQRHELLDYETYRDQRDAERQRIFGIKSDRRIHLGEALTFLFENHDTIRYQVQEMMLHERLVKEAAIEHELETYNALLGGPGELGCSLLIEIDDPDERAKKLHAWLGLPGHLYVELADGTRVYATFDPAQVGEDRLSAVQYLKFATQRRTPIAMGCDHPGYNAQTELTARQRQALTSDLGS